MIIWYADIIGLNKNEYLSVDNKFEMSNGSLV
jgi:hypothetical protein